MNFCGIREFNFIHFQNTKISSFECVTKLIKQNLLKASCYKLGVKLSYQEKRIYVCFFQKKIK